MEHRDGRKMPACCGRRDCERAVDTLKYRLRQRLAGIPFTLFVTFTKDAAPDDSGLDAFHAGIKQVKERILSECGNGVSSYSELVPTEYMQFEVGERGGLLHQHALLETQAFIGAGCNPFCDGGPDSYCRKRFYGRSKVWADEHRLDGGHIDGVSRWCHQAGLGYVVKVKPAQPHHANYMLKYYLTTDLAVLPEGRRRFQTRGVRPYIPEPGWHYVPDDEPRDRRTLAEMFGDNGAAEVIERERASASASAAGRTSSEQAAFPFRENGKRVLNSAGASPPTGCTPKRRATPRSRGGSAVRHSLDKDCLTAEPQRDLDVHSDEFRQLTALVFWRAVKPP